MESKNTPMGNLRLVLWLQACAAGAFSLISPAQLVWLDLEADSVVIASVVQGSGVIVLCG